MTENAHEIATKKAQDMKATCEELPLFTKRVVRLGGIACCYNTDGTESIKAEQECKDGLAALQAKGGLQEMLVAQMLSIHQLQQFSVAMANKTSHQDVRQYYTNTSIKLANTFAQQANILNKLQGGGQQKIIVEHVEVHHGGQAIVGSISGGAPTNDAQK